MSRPSFNSVGAIQSGSLASSANVNKPAGAVKGKAWIILLQLANARTPATPAGFAVLGTNTTQFAAFIRICDGTEGATQTVSWTGGTSNWRAIPVVYNDVDSITPVLVASAWTAIASGAAAIAAASVTPPSTSGNDLLVSIGQILGNTNVMTKPASMTQDFQNNATQTFAMASEVAVDGASGTRTWTWSGSTGAGSMNFVLKGTPNEALDFL